MRKIVLTGPESTGKTYLAKHLADSKNAPFVPEYARTYLTEIARPYKYEDLLEIAKGQAQIESNALSNGWNSTVVMVDTDLITIYIWSLHKYQKVDTWIEEQIWKHANKHYLLCYPDIDWEPDVMRENPEKGLFFFEWYERVLRKIGASYSVISGNYLDRINVAEGILAQVECEMTK